ncbi:hypothetical protein, partial [Roseinatronobacter thiooxidans]
PSADAYQKIRKVTGCGSLSTIYRFLVELQSEHEPDAAGCQNESHARDDSSCSEKLMFRNEEIGKIQEDSSNKIVKDLPGTTSLEKCRSCQCLRKEAQTVLQLKRDIKEIKGQLRILMQEAEVHSKRSRKLWAEDDWATDRIDQMTGVPLFDDIHRDKNSVSAKR